ncbi:MAG: hypothetical protein KDK39_02230 [Leptospiraceae bacterium]|nr:hypothetical protein [Leptospiraceae bacterium]
MRRKRWRGALVGILLAALTSGTCAQYTADPGALGYLLLTGSTTPPPSTTGGDTDTSPPVLLIDSVQEGQILVPPASSSPNLNLNLIGSIQDPNLDSSSVVLEWKTAVSAVWTSAAVSFQNSQQWKTVSPLAISGTQGYQVRLSASDTLGHSATLLVSFTVDATSQITLTNPLDGDVFVSNSIQFGGTATDADGISLVEVLVTYNNQTFTYTANNDSGTWSTWSYAASALPWNTPISVRARMTDTPGNQMYSNTVLVTAQQKLSFGNTLTGLPADESYGAWVNYTNFSDPVIIAAIKPGAAGDGGVVSFGAPCVIANSGADVNNGRFVDAGVDNKEEDLASASAVITKDTANSRFKVRVHNSGVNCARMVTEDVWYFIVEANTAVNQHYTLPDGGELEADHFTLDPSNCVICPGSTYQRVNFRKSFGTPPLVFLQQTSDNDPAFVITKISSVDVNGFNVAFQADAGAPAYHLQAEQFSYVAIELIDQSGGAADHQYASSVFNNQRIQIGRIGMTSGFNAWNEAGNTKSIQMQHTYTSPLLFLNMNTNTGGNTAYARAHGITLSDGANAGHTTFDAYVEDTDSRSHSGEETFVYFAVESN